MRLHLADDVRWLHSFLSRRAALGSLVRRTGKLLGRLSQLLLVSCIPMSAQPALDRFGGEFGSRADAELREGVYQVGLDCRP